MRHPSVFESIGREIIVGLGRIGGRAAAAGVKSVMKDGEKLASEAQRRLERGRRRLEEIVGGEPE